MGLFGTVGKLVGAALLGSGSIQMKLLGGLVTLLASGSVVGGLRGMVNSFQQNGLGDIVSSWISTGPNQAISTEQLKQGLGENQLRQLATEAGVSTEEASSQLTQLLPKLIDFLTPDGTVPDESKLAEALNSVPKNKLFG
jgi:uncharacterized protein YidB (DUF937 family)